MSRYTKKINEHTTMVFGMDVALGLFIELSDSRVTDPDPDINMLLLDYCDRFGTTVNLLDLNRNQIRAIDFIDMKKTEKLIKYKLYKFIGKRYLQNMN